MSVIQRSIVLIQLLNYIYVMYRLINFYLDKIIKFDGRNLNKSFYLVEKNFRFIETFWNIFEIHKITDSLDIYRLILFLFGYNKLHYIEKKFK